MFINIGINFLLYQLFISGNHGTPQTKIRVRLTLAYIPFYSYSNYYNSYTVHPHTAFQVIFALKKRYLRFKKNVPRRVRSAYCFLVLGRHSYVVLSPKERLVIQEHNVLYTYLNLQ